MVDFVRRLFSMYTLMVLVGYTLLILIGWLAAIVILKIQRDQIDLTYVLSENDGGASMSRFQLMIFTFVISLSFFLVIVGNGENPPRFPEAIPPGVLALLGISASSYLVSKGIQQNTEEAAAAAAIAVTPSAAKVAAGGTQDFVAKDFAGMTATVTWSIEPNDPAVYGQIDPKMGHYVAPAAVPAAKHITVKATTSGQVVGSATIDLS